MTVCGELDGLMRLTRCAESVWHQSENIKAAQKGLFPVVGLKGLNHWSFSSGAVPDIVKKSDFKAEVDETEAHKQLAKATVAFFSQVIGKQAFINLGIDVNQVDFTALVTALKLENSYFMKQPCNDGADVNPPSKTCLTGSPWLSLYAHNIMAGDIANKNIIVVSSDNFHPAP